MRFAVRAALVSVALAGTSLVAAPGGAEAFGTTQSTLVSPVPSANTPNVANGIVLAVSQVGTKVIIGGTFTAASAPGKTTPTVTRNNLLAFDSTTGAIDTTFNPSPNGTVEQILPGPSPSTVYVMGSFTTVGGATSKGIALLSTLTGLLVPGWKVPKLDGVVWTARLAGSHLIIGGTFTKIGTAAHAGLGSLNATTGALDPYVTVQLAGHHNYTGQPGQSDGPVGARRMDLSPDGTRLVVIGNFKTANGLSRDQILVADLGGGGFVLDPNWATAKFSAACASSAYDTYVRDVAFSPDGSYFAVGATGGNTFDVNVDGSRSLCDTATRWATGATGADVAPTWVDYTGNDSFESIATSQSAIYLGGHQRWVNNSSGSDYADVGAVPRPGIVALDPVNGLPFSWNPGRNPRGAGAYALLVTPSGLYVGMDTTYIGNKAYYRGRVALFPLAGGETLPSVAVASLPGNVYLAGSLPKTPATNVLYRVNAGGPTLQSIDAGPDWAGDQVDPSPYRNSGSNFDTSSPVPAVDSTVPTSTPRGIFDSERWDPGAPGDGGEMHWQFTVPAGVPIEVRLYFANRYSGTSQPGQRVFDVAVNGTTVLPGFDIVAAAGDQTGTMRKVDFPTGVPAGQVTLDFTHQVENPLVDGIEIVRTDQTPPSTAPLDTFVYRHFNGTTAGATTNGPAGTTTWSQLRGAFMAGNQLFYGWTDGNLYRRTFDGTTLGTPALVDPYDDPTWDNVQTGSGQTYQGVKSSLYGSEMQNVTGMFYTAGRLYYTLDGQPSLYYRYFTPESGVVGSDEFTAGGTADLSKVAGMFLSGSTLYYANRTDGSLHRLAFNSGAPDGTTDTTVNKAVDWRTHGMLVLP
jgi:Malectin domain